MYLPRRIRQIQDESRPADALAGPRNDRVGRLRKREPRLAPLPHRTGLHPREAERIPRPAQLRHQPSGRRRRIQPARRRPHPPGQNRPPVNDLARRQILPPRRLPDARARG